MDFGTALGIIAGIATTSSFLPQVIKAWKTRSVKDVSLWMLILLSTGLFFWILYGLAIKSVPVVIANSLTLAQALIVLWLKIREKKD